MICDKIFYMTFNDLRKNAYKSSVSQNAAQKKIQVQKEDLSSQKEKSKKEIPILYKFKNKFANKKKV